MALINVWLLIILMPLRLTPWRFGVCLYSCGLRCLEIIGKATLRTDRKGCKVTVLAPPSLPSVFYFPVLLVMGVMHQPWVQVRLSFSLYQSLWFFAFLKWLYFILYSAFIMLLNPSSPLYPLCHGPVLKLHHLLSELLKWLPEWYIQSGLLVLIVHPSPCC